MRAVVALAVAVSASQRVHDRHAVRSCTNVSVVGDATYCVQGAICGDQGDVCPKQGDAAVADCVSTLSSYVGATATCVAPADATCQNISSGARGCVFGTVAKTSTTPATTTSIPTADAALTTPPTTGATKANSSNVCSTKWSQCNGQNWPFGVCCQDASFECVRKNDYLSLCEPKQPKRKEHSAAAGTVAAWEQCGGKAYRGDSVCTPGNVCQVINEWLSQCQPATTDDEENALATYAQCGGVGFTATNKVCRDDDTCFQYNEVYSQCVPRTSQEHRRVVHGRGDEEQERLAIQNLRDDQMPPWQATDPVPPLEPGPYTDEGGRKRTEGRCAGYKYFDCCDYDVQCNWVDDLNPNFVCVRGQCQHKDL